jgi:hypothetical protein
MNEARDVLVIDDEAERLQPLVAAVSDALGDEVQVRAWQPQTGEDPLGRFDDEVAQGLALIVTDDDLTKSQLGLLGSAVTTWAQDRFIPVCNFSRKPARRLPREHNFFELRVPKEPTDAGRAEYIARVYGGFEQVRSYIATADEGRPTAHLLAGAMGVPELEDDLAPFLASAASASSAFMRTVVLEDGRPSERDRIDLLTFILGHVLVNAVLEFPGPILSKTTLPAYCAVSVGMTDALVKLFASASYDGPFAAPRSYFQRRLVDREVDLLAQDLQDEPEEPDQYTRAVVQRALGPLENHGCSRCGGVRGGYWCPFTRRPVCNRPDCSVTSDAWIPRGATLCRVERDYFDEVAPLLGE